MDRDHGADTGLTRTRDHIIEFAFEILKIQMAVAIDKHCLAGGFCVDIAWKNRGRLWQRRSGYQGMVRAKMGKCS